LEIIVIDNASDDGTPDMVSRDFPSVQLVANSENMGFARANNIGLKRAQGRYWMLLNPDTEVLPDAPNPFRLLVEFMDQHTRAGVCGASLFYPDGTRQHSAFRFPGLAQVYMDLYPVNWRLRESSWNGRYPFALYDRGEPFQIDHPLGATLLVRPEATEQVGLLDEDYFIYAEEVDWCMRMKRAGWQVWCVPQARVVHHEGRSTRQFRDKMFVELWRARFTLFRKNYSPLFNRAVRPLIRKGMERAIRNAESDVTQDDANKKIEAYRRVIALSRQEK
jgi:GT2 family glycosyltransferase